MRRLSVGSIPTEMRPHDGYCEALDGGYKGYQARCWDCDWTGTKYLRGDEEWGTDESRRHKRNAQIEVAEHRETTMLECCSRCRRSLKEATEDGC